MYDLEDVFSIYDVDENQIIIRVDCKNALKVATYPFLKIEWEYITITRGRGNIVKVVNKDGSSFMFKLEEPDTAELKELREQLLIFIREQFILLQYTGYNVRRASIFRNKYDDFWIEIGSVEWKCRYANTIEEAIQEAKNWGLTADRWDQETEEVTNVVKTGFFSKETYTTQKKLNHWNAVNPHNNLR